MVFLVSFLRRKTNDYAHSPSLHTSGGVPALFEERGRNQSTADRRQAASVFCLRQRPNEGQTNYWWKSSLFKLKATHSLPSPLGVLRDGPDANQGFNQALLLRAPHRHRTHTYSPSLKSEQAPKPLSLSSLSPHSDRDSNFGLVNGTSCLVKLLPEQSASRAVWLVLNTTEIGVSSPNQN